MNRVLDVIGDDDPDLQDVPRLIRTHQHHEIVLINTATGNRVLHGMPYVIIRDPVPASTRQDLHSDNNSCRVRATQQRLAALQLRASFEIAPEEQHLPRPAPQTGEITCHQNVQQNPTQQSLADAVGIHVTQLRRYEAGTSQPTLDVLNRIAASLTVSINSLANNDNHLPQDLRRHFEAINQLDEDK